MKRNTVSVYQAGSMLYSGITDYFGAVYAC